MKQLPQAELEKQLRNLRGRIAVLEDRVDSNDARKKLDTVARALDGVATHPKQAAVLTTAYKVLCDIEADYRAGDC